MDFCVKCQNFLEPFLIEGIYKARCRVCGEVYPLKSNRIYFENLQKEDTSINSYIRAAKEDITYEKIKKKCPKCKGEIVNRIRDTSDLKSVYICTTCPHSWK